MLRQLFIGGAVSLGNIAVHAVTMMVIIRARGDVRITVKTIDGTTVLPAAIQPSDLFERLAINAALFPRGIDVVLVHDDAIVAIPRTTRLVAKGD